MMAELSEEPSALFDEDSTLMNLVMKHRVVNRNKMESTVNYLRN